MKKTCLCILDDDNHQEHKLQLGYQSRSISPSPNKHEAFERRHATAEDELFFEKIKI